MKIVILILKYHAMKIIILHVSKWILFFISNLKNLNTEFKSIISKITIDEFIKSDKFIIACKVGDK